MKGHAVLTVDVEMDAPPYMDTWRGVEEGLPKLLDLLRETGFKATFFTLGLVAVKYPRLINRILDDGHELCSHGWDHRRLDKLSFSEASENIKKSLATLRKFSEIDCFRAPNFKLPESLLPVLSKEGVRIDSSIASYKPPFPRGLKVEYGVLRLPATHPSSIFRLPSPIIKSILRLSGNTIVLDLHPWELVKIRCSSRPDLTFGIGEHLVARVVEILRYMNMLGYEVNTLKKIVDRIYFLRV